MEAEGTIMNNKVTFTLTGRQILYGLLILAFGIGSLMTVGQAFAQQPDPAAADSSCDGAGQTNAVNGLGHVTYNCGIWKVVYHNGQPYLQWSPRDVSAGNEGFPGTEEWYPNTPGTVLPDYPIMNNPAPRNLVTNQPLDVTITDGVITILPSDGNGSVTVVSPDNATQPNEETAKKGFRCKATGNGYQLNDVSVNADNTGFFVEVDAATLDSWALLNGQSLNDVQSDYCGSLDPNAPTAVTVTEAAVNSGATNDTATGIITIPLGNGNTVTTDGTGAVTITDTSGAVVASGTDGTAVINNTTIVVPVNGTVTQPDNAVGAGSGNSTDANGHEGEILSCEVNNGGQEVCHWVKP